MKKKVFEDEEDSDDSSSGDEKLIRAMQRAGVDGENEEAIKA